MLVILLQAFSQVPSSSTILLATVGIGILWKLNQVANILAFEHEILVQDYCERKGLTRSELPSRTNVMVRSAKGGS